MSFTVFLWTRINKSNCKIWLAISTVEIHETCVDPLPRPGSPSLIARYRWLKKNRRIISRSELYARQNKRLQMKRFDKVINHISFQLNITMSLRVNISQLLSSASLSSQGQGLVKHATIDTFSPTAYVGLPCCDWKYWNHNLLKLRSSISSHM